MTGAADAVILRAFLTTLLPIVADTARLITECSHPAGRAVAVTGYRVTGRVVGAVASLTAVFPPSTHLAPAFALHSCAYKN